MTATAPVIACLRHRIGSDGEGVTTLVALHGCPLKCHWCINRHVLGPEIKTTRMTPQELYEKVRIDNLYFCATNGGITFGGGEPLLYPDFIEQFRQVCPEEWRITLETSLAVPVENVLKIAECVDLFIIDCKDTDPGIYHSYTSGDNAIMLDNLKTLLNIVPSEKIIVRLPLIPDFNTEENRKNSRDLLEKMGVTRFNEFTYTTENLT